MVENNPTSNCLGRHCILDIVPLGSYYYQALTDFFVETKEFHQEDRWQVSTVYQQTIADLIRVLKTDPLEMNIVEILKAFPIAESINSVILSTEYIDQERLSLICQEHLLALYLFLKPQVDPIDCYALLPYNVAMDHIVAVEVLNS